VSIRNRNLLVLSVMKRRPVCVVQSFAAADVCRVSFPVGCTCRAASNFALGLRSAGDISRALSRCRA
jgi:hypothetical protein